MNLRTSRSFAAIFAAVTLTTLLLTGCSSSDQSQAGETDAQNAKRMATMKQHKAAQENGH